MHARHFDASDESAVKAVVDDAVSKYGRLDVFFANAGVLGTAKLFEDIEAAEFESTMRTNALRYLRPLISVTRLPLSLRPFSPSPKAPMRR